MGPSAAFGAGADGRSTNVSLVVDVYMRVNRDWKSLWRMAEDGGDDSREI